MPLRPRVVAFDAAETLLSLDALRPRLEGVGLGDALPLWFARILRDGMAASLSGTYMPFSQVAASALDVLLAERGGPRGPEVLEAVMAGFAQLSPCPDAGPALDLLAGAGIRTIVLTNAGADGTAALLDRAGLSGHIERVVSIDEVRCWKPGPQPYLHAAALCRVMPAEMAHVAVHAWDVHGAHQAGLLTGWASRLEGAWTPAMRRPDVTGRTLVEVAEGLLALPAPGEPAQAVTAGARSSQAVNPSPSPKQ